MRVVRSVLPQEHPYSRAEPMTARESSITDMLLGSRKGLSRRFSKIRLCDRTLRKMASQWPERSRCPCPFSVSERTQGLLVFKRVVRHQLFDLNPIMSRRGEFEEFQGDSSEIIVKEALRFHGGTGTLEQPFFTVIWYGTPHSPWMALRRDAKPFQGLNENSKNHYAELRAMDRSIGTLDPV